ncbi:fungal-specific transcription factor domain-containing protein [Xylaria palmicola]|nr:fungal-specific transcription factor domain-containing protein [Xylaria palmicola]
MEGNRLCHNCRQKRLRCDRSIPVCYKCTKTGQRCLGYAKLYRWVDAGDPVGRGGQDRSAALTSLPRHDHWSHSRACCGTPQENRKLGKQEDELHPTIRISLADPLLQDLSGSSRHYLSYFASRICQDLVVYDSVERGTNPFRELIPMSQTYSYLQHIIIAVSAVHYYHTIKNARSDIAGRSRAAQDALVDALRARQAAIRELIDIIQEQGTGDHHAETQADQDALLATVLFFVNFTLIDSGRGGWKDHLTAAGRLLSLYTPHTGPLSLHAGDNGQPQLDYPPPSIPDLDSLSAPIKPEECLQVEGLKLSACDYVTSDTVAYFIWNCALESLVSPSSASSSSSWPLPPSSDYAAQPLTWDVAQVLRILSRTEANSYHSCPVHLMGIVLRVARVTQHLKTSGGGRSLPAAPQTDAYLALLREAETFDVEAWAAGVSTHMISLLGVMSEQERQLRCYIAATYRAAVCLYVLLVAPGLPAEIRRRRQQRAWLRPDGGCDDLPTLPTTADLVTTIVQQLSSIPKTSPLFKYTLWPLFLTGVDAVSDAQRRWVVDRLCAMRDLCPWGMMTSAMETLAEIWQLRDGVVKREGGGGAESSEVSKSDDDASDWLARLQGLKIDCLIV